MRFVLSLLLAVAVSLALFALMFQLINQDTAQVPQRQIAEKVDISRVKPETPEQKAQQQAEKTEPEMAPLSVEPPAATGISSDVSVDMPVDSIEWQNDELAVEQKYWSQPAASGGGGDGDYIGEMDTGTREVVPVSTSRPNIPKVAYDNRIDGWVLLAFTVSPEGKVSNIRVMDAEPRGVFEANAIAAVKGWIYQPFEGEPRHISQRIEFEWSMYPYNMDLD